MNRFWAAALLLPLISLVLRPVSASLVADPTTGPTPTVQPTSSSFVVDAVVETEGIGIPDSLILATDFGNNTAHRHENLGSTHYRDFLQVRLDSTEMWIFEHEGNLGVGGTRSDESWELFPVIVPTPFTMTVSVQNPGMLCQNATVPHCGDVTILGNQPVFTLEHNKSYTIHLLVDYTRGANFDQDYFTVTSSMQ
jgi:hypothetical protein